MFTFTSFKHIKSSYRPAKKNHIPHVLMIHFQLSIHFCDTFWIRFQQYKGEKKRHFSQTNEHINIWHKSKHAITRALSLANHRYMWRDAVCLFWCRLVINGFAHSFVWHQLMWADDCINRRSMALCQNSLITVLLRLYASTDLRFQTGIKYKWNQHAHRMDSIVVWMLFCASKCNWMLCNKYK